MRKLFFAVAFWRRLPSNKNVFNFKSKSAGSPSRTVSVRPKEQFEKIAPALKQLWGSDADVYQFDNLRVRNVLNHLPFLADGRVLDIGCNSGIYSLLLAPWAESVLGIDVGDNFLKRAQEAKAYFQKNVHDVSNVHFEKCHMGGLEPKKMRIDTILACNVLYHLNDEEIGILRQIMKNCRRVLFQMRPRRAWAYENNKAHYIFVSRNSVCGGLYTIGHAVEFLQSAGFGDIQIVEEEGYWHNELFPLVMATRK